MSMHKKSGQVGKWASGQVCMACMACPELVGGGGGFCKIRGLAASCHSEPVGIHTSRFRVRTGPSQSVSSEAGEESHGATGLRFGYPAISNAEQLVQGLVPRNVSPAGGVL